MRGYSEEERRGWGGGGGGEGGRKGMGLKNEVQYMYIHVINDDIKESKVYAHSSN